MNYAETTEYLFGAMPSFQNVGGDAYKPGLERIEAFATLLGSPQNSYGVVHVAGTNGKGSTSHMLAAVLRSAGYRVGLFTSPHLKDFRERMRVDGEMISEADVVDFVAEHRDAMERLGLSFFEMTAAMAFDFFARSEVDIAVVECGLGGRLDATNIVSPLLSIITNIGVDHTQYLGGTLEEIAAEKAGIMKRGVVAIIGDRGSVADIFSSKAAEHGAAELIFAQDRYDCFGEYVQGFELDLLGDYQRKNLVTLLTAVDTLNSLNSLGPLKYEIAERDLRAGLSRVGSLTGLRGRWQVICEAPLTICDTGHNVHGLREVTAQLRRLMESRVVEGAAPQLYCVLGFARDKDLRQILEMFPSDAHFCFVRAAVERAFTAAEIGAVAAELSLSFDCFEDVESGLRHARQFAERDAVIFVGGSTFVVAEV